MKIGHKFTSIEMCLLKMRYKSVRRRSLAEQEHANLFESFLRMSTLHLNHLNVGKKAKKGHSNRRLDEAWAPATISEMSFKY